MPEDPPNWAEPRGLPEDKALAFAMRTHERLGVQGSKQTGRPQASPVSSLPPEMVTWYQSGVGRGRRAAREQRKASSGSWVVD